MPDESLEKYKEWVATNFDSDIKEQLFDIYKESMYGEQSDAGRISKTIAKASNLFARLSADQEASAKKLIVQTDKLVRFSKYLLWFTIALVVTSVIQIGVAFFDVWIAKQL